MYTESGSKNIFSISKLNRLAKAILSTEIGTVWVSAELSSLTFAASGHWYFTLKDDKAQIRAAMFKGANRRVNPKPKEGDKVLVRGSISLYEARGDYQLIVEHMEADGEGLLKQQFDQLKIKLSAEGLFAQQDKQAIPDSLTTVAIITSSTGAALHDILTVLKRRNPLLNVIVYPSQVQGAEAPQQLIKALQLANDRKETQAIILGRGGGSMEDLACFNDEGLARAIYASEIPVISAVGHEVDVTIADFVADLRAPTPSAAAELLSIDINQLQQTMQQGLQRINHNLERRIQASQEQLRHLQTRLQQQHPQSRIQQQQQHLDQLNIALVRSLERQQQNRSQRLQQLLGRLAQQRPMAKIQHLRDKLTQLKRRHREAMAHLIQQKRNKLSHHGALLDTVSPLATLQRGYSISYHQNKVITEAAQVTQGDDMTTQTADGQIISQVVKVYTDP